MHGNQLEITAFYILGFFGGARSVVLWQECPPYINMFWQDTCQPPWDRAFLETVTYYLHLSVKVWKCSNWQQHTTSQYTKNSPHLFSVSLFLLGKKTKTGTSYLVASGMLLWYKIPMVALKITCSSQTLHLFVNFLRARHSMFLI